MYVTLRKLADISYCGIGRHNLSQFNFYFDCKMLTITFREDFHEYFMSVRVPALRSNEFPKAILCSSVA
jgi:hypothetical protein